MKQIDKAPILTNNCSCSRWVRHRGGERFSHLGRCRNKSTATAWISPMSTITRKAKNDIEFIEIESQRFNRPADGRHCEAMIGLVLQAAGWICKASEPVSELDVDACEELLDLSQRGLLVSSHIESTCAAQFQGREELRQFEEFCSAAGNLAVLRDRLLSRFEEVEEESWEEINDGSPSSEQLRESAMRNRAPQEWYDEQPDISPLKVPDGDKTTQDRLDHLSPAE